MKLITLQLSGSLRWNIAPSDSIEIPAISEPAISVVNPFAVVDDKQGKNPIRLPDGRLHIITNFLHLLVPTELEFDANFHQRIMEWLRLLRLVTKQAALPTDIVAYHTLKKDLIPELTLTLPNKFPKGVMFGQFHIDTALNADAIRRAFQLQSDLSIPICHELLLDALLAFENRRNRESILYSAIAIESLARWFLDEEYERVLSTPIPPSHLNVLSFQQAGGVIVKKDPIFALLSESDNFGRLLHEAPLYLMRRSLLNDNPDLYARARSLYGTRNRLGHGQTISNADTHLLSVNGEGAFRAIETAINVFAWYGATGYCAPIFNAVEFDG